MIGRMPAIARIWRGRTTRAKADEYEAYWLSQMDRLREQSAGLDLMREDRGDETEFMSISWWDSLEAMAAFSGSTSADDVHHLDRDAELLIELPGSVQILRVLPGTTGRG